MGPPRAVLDNIAGQEGAEVGVIVIAENEDICEEALWQLQVEWEVLPHIVDLRKGREPDAPVIRPTTPAPKEGDPDGGFGN
jgi:CO/xanthine dehydrogenase Mo-binding subunit